MGGISLDVRQNETYSMNRFIIGLLLLPMVSAFAELTQEQKAENRLHEILGTQSILKDLRYGDPSRYGARLLMIDVPDGSRHSVLLQTHRLFHNLSKLGTRDAVRVLAGFLDDNRYVSEPGSDYGAMTIAEQAWDALDAIRREHPNSVPGAPSLAPPHDSDDGKVWDEWFESVYRLRVDAWQRWWIANKESYDNHVVADPDPQ